MTAIKNNSVPVTPHIEKDYRNYKTDSCALPEVTKLGWYFSPKSRAARGLANDIEAGNDSSAKVRGGKVVVDVPYDTATRSFYEGVEAKANAAGICAEVKGYTPFPSLKEFVRLVSDLMKPMPYFP